MTEYLTLLRSSPEALTYVKTFRGLFVQRGEEQVLNTKLKHTLTGPQASPVVSRQDPASDPTT